MRYRTATLLMFVLAAGVAHALDDGFGVLQGTVAISLHNDRPVTAGVLTAMRHETEAIVAASGIRLLWDPDTSTMQTRFAVIGLRGNCHSDAPPIAASSAAIPLGRTQVVEGKVLPFADLECDAIRGLIDRDLRADIANGDELLGRAMGRVLAHELYHVLLRTTVHGRKGLARPAQSSADLLATRRTFAEAEEKRLSEISGGTQAAEIYPAGR